MLYLKIKLIDLLKVQTNSYLEAHCHWYK